MISPQRKRRPDLMGQAGWMYADLFLALMVIFLATISFVPKVVSSPIKNLVSRPKSGEISPRSMTKIYDSFNIERIRADITEYENANGVPPDAQISYIQIVGGYKAANENADQGAMRALVFGLKMSSADSVRFSKIGANLDSSPTLQVEQVELKLTFG